MCTFASRDTPSSSPTRVAHLQPEPTPAPQDFRLGDLKQTQQLTTKGPRQPFLTAENGDLDVTYRHNAVHRHSSYRQAGLYTSIVITRQFYQGLGVVAVGSVPLGDFTSVLNIASSLPAVLVQNGCSREADSTAANYLLDTGRNPKALAAMLKRLEQQHDGGSLPDLFSSHPSTDERIKNLENTR
jgi:hypothetical protein